ncbi:MAG: UDP-N-acetylmuramoyl-L-alanine--D-glutamate ligase [Acidimicrobiia bacterium]
MRVVVIGLAATGMAVTRVLRAEGWDVTILEDVPNGSSAYAGRAIEAHDLGAQILETPSVESIRIAVASADLVVPSPLVPFAHPALDAARDSGIPIRSEIDLAGARAHAPIVAISGTNGKTTVTTLAAAMLNESGRRAVAAGNVGRPLIDAAGDDVDVLVAEVSSFQLACSETFHPHVAVVLAITPDHLDWHGSYERYVSDKARISAHQTADDLLVFDADDADASMIAHTTDARAVGFSRNADAIGRAREVDGQLLTADDTVMASVAGMRRALVHDRTNALAAGVAALAVGATPAGIRSALASYATLPHRVALVGEANGVRWYDDSKATNPDATLRALESFDSVVLLAGGRNKGLDLGVLARAATRVRGVVAFGEASTDIVAAFGESSTVVAVASMHDAVRAAAQLARAGDAVLLSPACASFDAYANYAERGDDFAAEVRGLLVEGASSP